MATRREVLEYAATHGAKAAGLHFGIPAGTIRSWRSRARKRSVRDGTPPPPPTPAEKWAAEALRVAERFLKRVCLGCGGSGQVDVPAVHRGSLLIRRGRRVPCPDCGGPVRRIEVTEWPKRKWAEGMRAAGDAGLGWSADEWALIRSGQVNPFGQRYTGRGDA